MEIMRFAIIILSKNDVTLSCAWMNLIMKIVKCSNVTKEEVFPVFFVNPSNAWKQRDTFLKTFSKHEEHIRIKRMCKCGELLDGICWYCILSALNLRVRFRKIQKCYFLSMGPREHLEWRGATRSDTGALKVPLSAKMTKMPLVNLGLTEDQTRSKFSQNNTFHSFISNSSFSEIFGNFDQIWPGVNLKWPRKP